MAKFLNNTGAQRFLAKIKEWATPVNIGAAPKMHSHSNATATAAGYMSAADKKQLDSTKISAETIKMFKNAGYPIE